MKRYEITILGNRIVIKTISKDLNKITYLNFKDAIKTINKMKEYDFDIIISEQVKQTIKL